MKIAVIGGGEVGRCYVQALIQAGQHVYLVIDKQPSTDLELMCSTLGICLERELSPSLAEADLVLCAVYGAVALATAQRALPYLKPNSLYADLTTGSPADMLEACTLLATKSVRFVDVAIAGAVGAQKEKTPLLLAGEHAADFLAITTFWQAPTKIVGPEAGAAVSLKLLRSIFTKGCEALAVECFVAAEQKGLRQALYEVLSDLDEQPISAFLERCVRSHATHAGRRLVEVGEAIEQMSALGLEPLASKGVENLFSQTVAQLQSTPYIADSLATDLEWLAASLRRS